MGSFYAFGASDEETMSSVLKNAGVNLVVGMGTVFAVLIFLTWVISLFKHINKLSGKISAKKTEPPKKNSTAPAPAPVPEPAPSISSPKPVFEPVQETLTAPAPEIKKQPEPLKPSASEKSSSQKNTEEENDDELSVVFAAAIAAYEADLAREKEEEEKKAGIIQKQPALQNGITIRKYRRK